MMASPSLKCPACVEMVVTNSQVVLKELVFNDHSRLYAFANVTFVAIRYSRSASPI